MAWEMENHISVPQPVSDALADKLDIRPDHSDLASTGLVAVLARPGPGSLVRHRLPQPPIST